MLGFILNIILAKKRMHVVLYNKNLKHSANLKAKLKKSQPAFKYIFFYLSTAVLILPYHMYWNHQSHHHDGVYNAYFVGSILSVQQHEHSRYGFCATVDPKFGIFSFSLHAVYKINPLFHKAKYKMRLVQLMAGFVSAVRPNQTHTAIMNIYQSRTSDL